MNIKVDLYFEKDSVWKPFLTQLREIVLSTGLEETLKWRHPCYTLHGKNVVLIHTFKEYCALLFFKGALLGDAKKILIRQSEQVQAGRQIRFRELKEVKAMKADIKAYIFEAIAVEEAGLSVPMKKTEEYPVPPVLKKIFKEDAGFKRAFYGLTPGRQRGYLLFFSQARQETTILNRIAKYKAHILSGRGLNDKL